MHGCLKPENESGAGSRVIEGDIAAMHLDKLRADGEAEAVAISARPRLEGLEQVGANQRWNAGAVIADPDDCRLAFPQCGYVDPRVRYRRIGLPESLQGIADEIG